MSAALELVELTAAAPGAIRVLRLRGAGALEAVRRIAPRLGALGDAPVLARLVVAGESLEEALVCRRGAHELELHLTGSEPLVQRVAAALGGWRRAEAARTLEERAWEELAHAPCEAAARILLDQARGALRRALEELPGLPEPERETRLAELCARGRRAARALRPTEVVLAGPANAGKSTLFNALLGEEQALVSPLPGTTRDALRASARLGPWPIALWDGAGERALPALADARGGLGPGESEPRAEALEQAGQRLFRALRERAELVLWLEPCTAPPRALPDRGWVRLRTQADRLGPEQRVPGAISALLDPEGARRRVEQLFRARFELPESAWEPGAAVPFLAEQLALLDGLRGAAEPALAAALARLCSG